jgi:hypothetical protein
VVKIQEKKQLLGKGGKLEEVEGVTAQMQIHL